MKLALDSFSFHLHFGKHWFKPSKIYDIKWYADFCKKSGLDGLHIDPMHIDIVSDIKWLKEFATKNNLYVELGAIGTEPDDLKKWIEAANFLGSKVLRAFIGGSCDEGKNALKKKSEIARKNLIQILPFAEDNNVIIALENHGDVFIENMQNILNIDSPYLGLCYDSGNFYSVGEDPLEAVKMFADKIVCTHLKDVCPPEKYPDAGTFGIEPYKTHFCALGDGKMPLKEIMEIIKKEKGDNFNITLEIHTPCRKSLPESDLLSFEIENVNKSIKYAREILGIS